MSDNWMIVLPIDPLAVPPRERADAALEMLSQLRPEAQEFDLYFSDFPEFFHCGGNFESVFCPFCQTDIVEWWGKAMDAWSNEADRRRLAIETPCCGRATSLNDLDYVEPQGFACVAIKVMNPDSDLEPSELQKVAQALRQPVRIVWRHI
jgi:hypothetical protein